jgi:2-methylisocitrate lyase-like PEP mutase family enzyme
MGYSIAIYPPLTLTAAYAGMKDKLTELKEKGVTEKGAHGGIPFDELVDLLGLKKYRTLEEKSLTKI